MDYYKVVSPRGEENITLQRSVAVLKPIKEIKSEYLVGVLKSDDVEKQLNKGVKGVAQKVLEMFPSNYKIEVIKGNIYLLDDL